jgi:hypothetical protein
VHSAWCRISILDQINVRQLWLFTYLHVPRLGEGMLSLHLLLRDVLSTMARVPEWVSTVDGNGGIVRGFSSGDIGDRREVINGVYPFLGAIGLA